MKSQKWKHRVTVKVLSVLAKRVHVEITRHITVTSQLLFIFHIQHFHLQFIITQLQLSLQSPTPMYCTLPSML